MLDAFLEHRTRAQWPEELSEFKVPFVLATLHRASNTDDPGLLKQILLGLSEIGLPVILPLHPRSAKAIQTLGLHVGPNVTLTGPLPYLGLLAVLGRCSFVVTDSGGLQKEAYYAGRRAVVLRNESEWVELVDAGSSLLVGADTRKIADSSKWAINKFSAEDGIYGDGHAARKIAALLA
jgi:UDP-N-acetylglucosamine 2-epimerase